MWGVRVSAWVSIPLCTNLAHVVVWVGLKTETVVSKRKRRWCEMR